MIETANYMPPEQIAKQEGFHNVEELLELYLGVEDDILACCEEGCRVEMDGYCPHGHPSILIALGMI